MPDADIDKQCQAILSRLKALGSPEVIEAKAKKFAVRAGDSFGVYQADINQLAKEIGKDSALAIALFKSGNYEARVLCAKVFHPKDLTVDLMDEWIASFENWEICDTFAMKLFARSPLAWTKLSDWAGREPEFERRAAFALLAGLSLADKKADNERYLEQLPLIEAAADDPRLYVKKGVSWALRSVGKRNPDLRQAAITCAEKLQDRKTPSATWIAKDVLKELTAATCRSSDYPRAIYRP